MDSPIKFRLLKYKKGKFVEIENWKCETWDDVAQNIIDNPDLHKYIQKNTQNLKKIIMDINNTDKYLIVRDSGILDVLFEQDKFKPKYL